MEFKAKWGISTEVGEKSELTKIFNSDGNTVCAIYTKPFTKKEKQANALLISKAPEMLKQLQNNALFLEEIGMMVTSEKWTEEFRDVWNKEMTKLESLIKHATEL